MLTFSLKVDKLDQGKPVKLDLHAERSDCDALADRFGWIEVRSLAASLEAEAVFGRTYDVKGKVEAAIVQRCRVTGNPVPESIAFDVHERFAATTDDGETAEIDPMAVSVEAVEDGVIPVGEMVAQLVGLEASAWPRDPEAEGPAAGETTPDPAHPFASLAELKKKH